MIGLYLDKLTDEQRDRVITAQLWEPGATLYHDGSRCLIGHVYDVRPGQITMYPRGTWYSVSGIGACFDALCDRFGKDRIVRAIKQRAAKGNRVASVVLPSVEVVS